MSVSDLILVAVIVSLTWAALKWKKIIFKKWQDRNYRFRGIDPLTLGKMDKVFTAAIFFLGSLFVLQALGLDVVPLVTFSGIGAAILGFASKDFVSNFYGGLMIYINRPFQVNDFIKMPSKNIAGSVEEIGWYLTTLRDKEKRSLYIPNSFFNTDTIINESRATHRRIEEVIHFRVEDVDQIEKIAAEAKHILRTHPDIDQNEPAEAFILSVGFYGSSLAIKAYTKSKDDFMFMKAKEDILCQIYRASTGLKFQRRAKDGS